MPALQGGLDELERHGEEAARKRTTVTIGQDDCNDRSVDLLGSILRDLLLFSENPFGCGYPFDQRTHETS